MRYVKKKLERWIIRRSKRGTVRTPPIVSKTDIVVELHDHLSWNFVEIAEELGMSPGSAYTVYMRRTDPKYHKKFLEYHRNFNKKRKAKKNAKRGRVQKGLQEFRESTAWI